MHWHTPMHAVVLLASMALLQHAAGARPCEESGYCSTGISQHWVGDIKESAKLREMLQAVTYKKELVITIFQENEGDQLWVDQALQLHFELEDMGYAHHLFVTDCEKSCKKMNLDQQISCVWDSSELPAHVLSGETGLWHNRWKLIARASRLGYNIMSTDTDFMWFRDPYIHFKGVLKDIQMLGVPEGGSAYNNNGGFMYVQNARPDGPVSWVFKQVTMSSLRRADDNYKYMSQFTRHTDNCLSFDQSIISDALEAAAVGRPIFVAAMRSCKMHRDVSFTTRAGNTLTPEQAKNNAESLVAGHMRAESRYVRPDTSWLDSLKVQDVPDFDSKLYISNITVPNLAWGYPDELGGRFAPLEVGSLSLAFTQQLKEDCPDCPWWSERRPLPPGDDPLISLLGPKFDSPHITRENMWAFYEQGVPQEVFAQVPNWLACSLGNVRRGWVLGKNAPLQGPMILGHVHAWHMQTHRAHKAMIRKVLGRYNWTLGTRVAKEDAGLPNPYGLRHEVNRVIGLSPNIDLARTRSWEEFSSIIAGLIQVAFLSNRVVLLPNLPCQTAWIHEPATIADPQAAPKLCVPPTFWSTPHRFPLPVTLAVDDRGELVGGWARRLRAIYKRAAMQQPGIPPILLRPDITDVSLEEQASGRVSGAWAGGPRRGLTADVPDDWWEKQRYVVAMPQLWDSSCTKDFKAIIYPELFHWLKNSDEGKQAELKPTKTNTVFTPSPTAEALKLRPPPPPGGDSAAVPAGSVVPTSKEPGWSLYDVQAALPVAEVIQQLQLVESQPLVYIDHPVMVVHTTTDLAKEKEMYAEDLARTAQGEGKSLIAHWIFGKAELPDITPDQAISAVNFYIRKGKQCKAVWTQVETHNGVPVHLGHGHPSVLVNGLIHPAPTQQATQ